MQVCCVAESICLEESHRMYVWIVQMLVEMEPRFQLNFIKMIFGDQALTDQILIEILSPGKIYGNPSHFAGWYLRTIEGNLLLNGSVPAEKSHSSMAAHLGAGASWSVVEQVTKLLLRQTHLTAKRQEKNTQAFVGTRNYKSQLQDQAGSDDEAAKKQLPYYAYHKLFLAEYKHSCRLRYVAHEDVTVFWPNGKPQNCDERVVINSGHRYGCQRRIAFKHQCRHGMCILGKLDHLVVESQDLVSRPSTTNCQ
jgi:hypothetical protein